MSVDLHEALVRKPDQSTAPLEPELQPNFVEKVLDSRLFQRLRESNITPIRVASISFVALYSLSKAEEGIDRLDIVPPPPSPFKATVVDSRWFEIFDTDPFAEATPSPNPISELSPREQHDHIASLQEVVEARRRAWL